MRRRADYLPDERCISVTPAFYARLVRGLRRAASGKIAPGEVKRLADRLINLALSREEARRR